MAFLGRAERMTAARAYELGIVSEVIDPPELLRGRGRRRLAEQIAATAGRPSSPRSKRARCGTIGETP